MNFCFFWICLLSIILFSSTVYSNDSSSVDFQKYTCGDLEKDLFVNQKRVTYVLGNIILSKLNEYEKEGKIIQKLKTSYYHHKVTFLCAKPVFFRTRIIDLIE